ncbi:MAG: hypothetical protein QG588_1678 [Candidatus Poribacteria bacterium]|nr:hypothetical protein [Candidatus Poribacteria bacterium]
MAHKRELLKPPTVKRYKNEVVPAKGENLLDEDRAITKGLMRLSERSLAHILENEPDICTLEDLKVIF